MANEIDESTIITELLCHLRNTFALDESSCYLVEEVGANADQITIGGDFILQVAPQELESINAEQSEAIDIVSMPVEIGICTAMQLDRFGKMETAILDCKRGSAKIAKQVRQALIGWDVAGDKLASLVYAKGRKRGKTAYDLDHSITWRVLTFHFDFDESTT